jgi:hypothetical protein
MSGAEPRPWLRAAAYLCVLCPFFFLSYGFANWAAGLRSHVPSLVFGWESHIPFLVWTIVPYWSTDLFYGVSLFLCRDRRELDIHACRLLFVQLVSVSVFLALPLRFSFERPDTGGLFGAMFTALMGFDRPFNQAPSLHLGLITVLWAKYADHTRGLVRWMIRSWFALMAISTLTTYQHHFIDLPSGVWVGLLALAVFPDTAPARRFPASSDPRRFLLAVRYLLVTLVLVLLAWGIGGAAWLLLWPAGATAIVAGIYFVGRAELFRKCGGRIPRPMLALLGPYLVAAWLNSRNAPKTVELTPGVLLGRIPGRSEREKLGIASIVDLCAELPVDVQGVQYRGVPVLDLTVPSVEQIDAGVQALQAFAGSRPTLVFCALGLFRSATVAAAWLVACDEAVSVKEAVETVRALQPRVVLNPAAVARLVEWASRRIT